MNRREFLRYGAFGLTATALPASLGFGQRRAGVDLDAIAHCAIYPSVGIARVGNSPTGWFLGPEVPGPHPVPPGGFKDSPGRLKRQAARFRIYAFDAEDRVLGEVTADQAEIAWTAHLANTKAAWYEFDIALDLPSARGEPPAPRHPASSPARSSRRNASVDDRGQLEIDPGPRSITGRSANSAGADPAFAFDSGEFFGSPVPLGELRTDEAGRLLVLGGFGHSAPAIPGLRASTLANNDLWHDDVSDGPVDATVTIDGREIPVTGAWVVVAPPNYAPGIQSVVTMYDLMFEVATDLEPDRRPVRPSFTRQIYPLFERMVQHQWVNAGFLRDFGWGSPGDFLAPETLAKLASAGAEHRFLRRQIYERFRDPAYLTMEGDALPPYYGDEMELREKTPRQWMAILPLQYEWLAQWAEGDFDADWPENGLMFANRLDDLPVEEQPDALNRATLDEVLGGAFHPGCELTWPMRHALLYEAPFRVRRRTEPARDWGPVLTAEIALDSEGPLAGSAPGDLTRWMAVPWQTDTSNCLSRYTNAIDEYLPTFWPATVPNDVLAESDYRVVLDSSEDLAARQAAFETRVKWVRHLPTSGAARLNAFIAEWSRAGVVTQQPGPHDGAPFPNPFWVEIGHDASAEDDEPEAAAPVATPVAATPAATPRR